MLAVPPETELLARRLAAKIGTTPEAIVREAVEAKALAAGFVAPAPVGAPKKQKGTLEELMAIARHCAALPVLDDRSADEILGYDENGLPT